MARFNIPPLTRSLLILLVGLTALNALLHPDFNFSLFLWFATVHPLLGLNPLYSIKYIWPFLTATFVERNVWGLVTTSLTLFFGGRYLERAWGLQEFAKFIAVICVIPNFLTWILIFIIHRSGSSNVWTSSTLISGGVAIQAAFLVAFKQLVPEHTVSILRGLIRMRVKHFPAVFLLANITSGILLSTDVAMFLAWYGFLVSWIYLRFYRISPLMTTATGGDVPTVRGDASDTFSFAYFFPEPLHTPLAKICDSVYDLLVTLRICTPFSADDIDLGNEAAMARAEAGGGGLPTTRGSGRREEAERRRALALKALDQRLHAASSVRGVTAITVPAPVAHADGPADGENAGGSKANGSSG